jgi:hypothetical protein
MKTKLKSILLVLVSLAFVAQAAAHSAASAPSQDAAAVDDQAYGRPGDPKRVNRVVRLEMSDSFRFTPAHVVVKRGETVRFIVHNAGSQFHEMVLGTTDQLREHAELMKRFPGMEHSEANMAHVQPGAHGDLVWQFTRAGTYQFACLVPGHYDAGMVGDVTVK